MVGDWCVTPDQDAISRDGRTERLEPLAMQVLVYLASRAGEVVPRSELEEAVWKGAVVSYDSVTSTVIKLRKALGDNARNPTYIATIPKRGYRLVTTVTSDQPSAKPATPSPFGNNIPNQKTTRYVRILSFAFLGALVIALAAVLLATLPGERDLSPSSESTLEIPDKPSIAVLPFVNTGNEAEYSYFSDGITDDLINDLSGVSGLFVISRNSTFQYKGQAVDIRRVAEALGVRYILEGSVRRSGDQVRVNTQLIDGLSGGQLWAERYDGQLRNVFDLQDQITTKIISALALQLTDSEQQRTKGETRSPQAYDEFLKGWEHRWRITRDDYAIAERHFLNALELDPTYARAHAALALIYWSTWKERWHINSEYQFAGWGRAQRQLDAAAHTPSTLAYSLRSAMQLYRHRFDSALSEAHAAIDLNPGDPTGFLALADVLSFTGRTSAAIEQARKALRLDPNFPAPYLQVEGRALFDNKQYQQAAQVLSRAIDANPADIDPMIVAIASYSYLGQREKARDMTQLLNKRLKQDNVPELTLDALSVGRWPYKDPAALEHLKAGLRIAGIPEW